MKTIRANWSLNQFKKSVTAFIAAIVLLITIQSCKKNNSSPLESSNYVALNSTMHNLWAEHMQWTYATVDAFFNNQSGLQASLDRLLQNQKDIGAAIVPYYGQAAGDTLASLLTTHIQEAVPVLQAAKAGDQNALQQALNNWYKNAQDIADFLTAANPKNWNSADMRDMMKGHIDQTTTYSVDLLQGNYKKAVVDYGAAFDHMMMMADMLSEGIAKQFPNKF
ncbi:MAG: hypothetical protein IT214_08375 [Chitinophagaceae bacterium]|jgi:hypothetical protein|nr:hypothetical protein [Chitinophagaceae bacterium]OQY92412.1 MAG: hypothetical protein B6D37_14055 [Sphingobacteriales bacterium UTBCD1]